MKGLEFPIIGTKVKGLTKKFDLSSPEKRKVYFQAKVGDEIIHIQKYLERETFIAFMLGKKNSGKGTYSKLFAEVFGGEKVATVSVGDLVRDVDANWEMYLKDGYVKRIENNYRGYMSFEDAVDALRNRSTSKLLPTEFILALMKTKIEDLKGKSIFIDGLPRETDQVSYSLYFRDLINYRNDPDMFVLIDVPESVIEGRIKTRIVCPKCGAPRSTKLLLTSIVKYNNKTKKFDIYCDNPECEGKGKLILVPKEGDELGLEPIRNRLIKDEEILRTAFSLHGVPKILLRNHVQVGNADEFFDEYELTPEYKPYLEKGKVKIKETPWVILDDNGEKGHSLLPPAVVVSMIKQMSEVLK